MADWIVNQCITYVKTAMVRHRARMSVHKPVGNRNISSVLNWFDISRYDKQDNIEYCSYTGKTAKTQPINPSDRICWRHTNAQQYSCNMLFIAVFQKQIKCRIQHNSGKTLPFHQRYAVKIYHVIKFSWIMNNSEIMHQICSSCQNRIAWCKLLPGIFEEVNLFGEA